MLNLDMPGRQRKKQTDASNELELLVLEFTLQLLRFCHLADCFIEVILIDCITVVPDGEQATVNMVSINTSEKWVVYIRFSHDVPQELH